LLAKSALILMAITLEAASHSWYRHLLLGALPMEHIASPTPSLLRSDCLSALSRELLLEQLDTTLKLLEPLSQAPPKVVNEKALWFHRHEFDQVNAMWKRDGIDAVASHYSSSRTFASGPSVPLDKAPSAVWKEAPHDAIVLILCEFGPNPVPDPAQQDYFRSGQIPLPSNAQSQILQALNQTGLLSRVRPKVDDLTTAFLEGAPITETQCATEWYGRNNYYGDGSTLIVTLTLTPPGHEPERLILAIDKSGEVQRRLWCDQFAETGYEGHAHASYPLTEEELRAIIPCVARVSEFPTQQRHQFQVGMWIGSSLSKDSCETPQTSA
jgi:hypothetical protein